VLCYNITFCAIGGATLFLHTYANLNKKKVPATKCGSRQSDVAPLVGDT
jgi:hypothetical protein